MKSSSGTKAGAHRPQTRNAMALIAAATLAGFVLSACDSGGTPGAIGPMGGPIVSADGQSASGTASAGGVEVLGSDIALGRVPLDVTVVPTWTLRNTTNADITLSGASIEVLEGCCPGQVAVDRKVIPPNETAELTFPLQMHEGMDGPHKFLVKVLVGDDQADMLVLGVTADFRN